MAKPNKPKRSTDGHKIGISKKSFKHKNDGKKKIYGKKPKSISTKIKEKKKFTSEKKEDVSKNKDERNLKRKSSANEIKDVKKEKKEKKDQSVVVTKLMAIYETLRRKGTSDAERNELIEKVLQMAIEKENEVVYKHDTVRVLEMCVKYGTEAQKEKLFELFKKNTVNLVQSKYAKFLIEKFIEYGSKEQKRKIVESFYGNVKKLIKHKGAAAILDEIYDKYANSSQRSALVEEFYGPELAIFKVASGRTLEDILENEPTKKITMLKHMKHSFITLCQKETVMHSIIHRALFTFFKYADLAQKVELVEVLKEAVVHILHSKDGAKVAMNCIWLGTTKDRKTIVKSFKTYVTKICKEEYGHLVMLALFDVIDDTVLMKKALFPEIISNLEDLMLDQYGRKVILYLLKPRSKSYFIPDVVKLLQQGDGNAHSKKEAETRQKELRDAILPELLEAMATPIKDIMTNKSASIVLLAALEISSDLSQATNLMTSIAKLIAKPIKAEDPEQADDVNNHPVCDSCGHWVIKSIVRQDKNRIERGEEILFSQLVCDAVPEGCFADWSTSNRGAFVVISLLESGIESVTTRVKDDLKFLTTTSEANGKGMEILKKLLLT